MDLYQTPYSGSLFGRLKSPHTKLSASTEQGSSTINRCSLVINIQTCDTSTNMICSHLLKFSYPAVELLPSGRRPYLEVPINVRYRERPKLGEFHLSTANLNFFLQLPTEPTPTAPDPLDDEDNKDITECISWLSMAPGVSELSAVSFIGGNDIWTRFSLATTWFTASGNVVEGVKFFEMPSMQWQLLQGYSDPTSKESWTAMMNDLFTAASDRAYLHRRIRLDAFDKNFADHDESTWISSWDEQQDVSPNQLLANHLEDMSTGADNSVPFAPVVTLSMHRDTENLSIRMPCGHQGVVNVGAFKNLTKEQCVAANCHEYFCQKKIMDKDDERLLDLVARKERTAMWNIDEIDWKRLDYEVQNQATATKVTSRDIYRSLKLALASMKVPESATPPALDPTDFTETKYIKRRFRKILDSDEVINNVSSRSILIKLQQEAGELLKIASPFESMETVISLLPPNFQEFLFQWLRRAVNNVLASSIGTNNDHVAADLSNIMTEIGKVNLHENAQEGADIDGNVEMDL